MRTRRRLQRDCGGDRGARAGAGTAAARRPISRRRSRPPRRRRPSAPKRTTCASTSIPTRDGAPVTDLTQDDFEIVEGGTPQKNRTVRARSSSAPPDRRKRASSRTPSPSRERCSRIRARACSSCFSTPITSTSAASHHIRKPLVDALDRVIGPDDLVAVMTPEMSPADIAFARKTTTIEGILTRYWHWGERDRCDSARSGRRNVRYCYPNVQPGGRPDCSDQNGLAAEMIDRRHEKRTIDALRDLVRFLRGVREERKAVLAITNGWLLFRPNYAMMKPLNCHGVPGGREPQVDPRNRPPDAEADAQQHSRVRFLRYRSCQPRPDR